MGSKLTQSNPKKLKELAGLLQENERRHTYNKLEYIFPATGPLRRELYPKQLEFFKAGRLCKERAMIAANRVGKTWSGGYEMTLHLTGLYPDDWEGYKFDRPIDAWAAGVTNETTKDVIQKVMLGDYADPGSGMIPKHLLVGKTVNRPGVPEAVQTVRVRHVSGGVSKLSFKSYDQKRVSFQGTEKDVIWLDEEPRDQGIYSECITRTMTTGGLIYCTFTPLFGLSDVVLAFMPGGIIPKGGMTEHGDKYIVQVGWDEVPHLHKDEKRKLLAAYSPYERDARAKGIPQLGSGAIYPILEEDIITDPFDIPAYWPRVYGMDVGWNKTAAVWAAIDPKTNQIFIYSEYYRGKVETPIHADAIKSRGDWIPGVIDPRADSSNQVDGSRLLDIYEELGLELCQADNAVESGLLKVWQQLSNGQLKVFKSCVNWLAEFRIYRRDENGKIVKKNDHLMDATRYLVMSGIHCAITEEDSIDFEGERQSDISIAQDRLSKGANVVTGY